MVDNNSTDGGLDRLEPKFPAVKFVRNDHNPGFGKACNQGLQIAKGRYILFLNPDTIIPEDCFLKCISFAEKSGNFGALGARMIDGSGHFLPESKRMFPTVLRAFFRLSGLGAIFPGSKIFSGYYAGHLKEHKTSVVDVLAGAFLFSRKDTLDALRGFDEDFFMYGEDIDLSYRIQQSGLVNYYYPEVTIIHFKGESLQKFSREHKKHFFGAMKLFVDKHYPKGISTAVLKAGITLSSALRKNNRESSAHAMNTIAVVSTDEHFQEIAKLIKYAKPPLTLAGRIAITNGENSIGSLDDLPACVAKIKFDSLLIHCNDTGFKNAIEITDKHKSILKYLFTTTRSSSLTGSSDPDKMGVVILNP